MISNRKCLMTPLLLQSRLMSALLSLLIAAVANSALAADAADTSEWKLRRDRDGIQIYTRKVAGSPYDAVRSVTLLDNVRLATLVAVFEATDSCPVWVVRCKESYVLERLNRVEALVYTNNDMPFPVKDRDVVVHAVWGQDPHTLAVTMNSNAVSGKLEEKRGRIRLAEAKISWRFKPLPLGAVEISSEAHINPGGSLPGWVTNRLIVSTPYNMLRAFVAEAQKPKYRDAQISFINEP